MSEKWCIRSAVGVGVYWPQGFITHSVLVSDLQKDLLNLISKLDDKMASKPSEWRVDGPCLELRLMLFAVMFTLIDSLMSITQAHISSSLYQIHNLFRYFWQNDQYYFIFVCLSAENHCSPVWCNLDKRNAENCDYTGWDPKSWLALILFNTLKEVEIMV